jgi:ubiquinone/menaquinone biosynthesis C-methylase UbiE
MSTGTEHYYAQRAREYDRVYDKPERQADIADLKQLIGTELAGRRVLDVAAGTGFWTAAYADAARAVTATDINDSTLEVARGRQPWPSHVDFQRCDAFSLDQVPGRFDAAFVGFFWSHVPVDRLEAFLAGLVGRLEPGAVVVIVDNHFVAGSNHPITRTDSDGNTYQRRELADGTRWEVLKNFPAPDEIVARLARHGDQPAVTSLTYYWAATVRTHGA